MVQRHPADDEDRDGHVRLDKWLWAARFFKTRALAVEAIAGGKVLCNGDRPKPARDVRLGDELRLHFGPYEHVVHVSLLTARRGPAKDAVLMYEETLESKAARAKLAEQLRHTSVFDPQADWTDSKKDRRELRRFRGKS